MDRKINGFTLVELVIVLVLIGILSIYVAPRFIGRDGFSELTVQQDLKQSIRFAQQLAMSRTDNPATVITSAAAIDVQYNGTRANGYPHNLPAEVPLNDLTISFDRFGRADFDGKILVKNGRDVCIVGATGYAHDC